MGILAQRSVQEDEEQPKVSLGDFLRERRAELKKPQRQMGMPSGQISQIESGVIPRVNPFTLLGLAESYEFSLSDLENSVAIDEELIASARTVLIGQAVMGLPDSELESIVESLGIGHIY